ncbi:hypothetical protein BTA51_23070 [Hahella sp. CCB-MM4]|uniref:hypothetical protein n=1 Tax=Hahella sp. (strain CCB-MM4) TaxID=1926491 RepID=UPI000B9BCBEC|nr:hypothetical protein [Hahella sp. CCB-MM4]OZG70990.1 hypothetical protein BTA51_23070 [Hahella sp. CCB-MM4]
MVWQIRFTVGVLIFFVAASCWPASLIVRYPKPETDTDKRTDYPLTLLQLALDTSGVDYRLEPTTQVMTQGRALQQLHKGTHVDVVWSMTSEQRESELLPIRIPIYKGLIGWRIFLIHKDNQNLFSHPMTLTELQRHPVVQGHDWPDSTILRDNGFQVFGTPNYNATFDMLAYKRVDLFPRSIVEIWAEEKAHHSSGLMVEKTKLLRYPTAFYYFVTPGNQKLADIIQRGLESALSKGSFDELFYQFHAALIAKATLKDRQVYFLDNTILPAATPLDRPELWFEASPKDSTSDN